MRSFLLVGLYSISCLITAAQPAQVHSQPHVEKLSDHAYAILGPGGNVGLFVTERSALLVDGQFEMGAPDLLKAVRTVTPSPIKYLVNTHHHPDHVGGNTFFALQKAILVAHTNVRRHLLAQKFQSTGLPELTFGDEDGGKPARLNMDVDGLELRLLHKGPGHTDGDVIVEAPAEKVLHLGDLFFHGLLPFIDTQAGGTLEGLLAQFEAFSALPEDIKVIPGHGPVCGRSGVLRHRDFLRALQAHVKANPSKSPRELAATFDTQPWSDYKPMEGFVTWESLFGAASGKGSGHVEK